MEARDYSYGIIPIKKDEDNFKFLMIKHLKGGHWSFPKGHKEPGETDIEAALRELTEETGISNFSLLNAQPLKEIYSFKKNGSTIKKTVNFYLAQVDGDNTTPQKEEIKEIIWISPEKAINLATYKGTRNLIKMAIKLIDASKLTYKTRL
jgi:bis(5'-nucleosidyl)-tetraphosphatase